jgi:DnaK suppressor protein
MTLSKEKKRQKQMDSARRSLLAMREKLIAGISQKTLPESLKGEPGKGDEADMASTFQDNELYALLSLRDKQKLRAIKEAMEKIDNGEYGVCEECGDEIGQGRLKAMPLAKLCVNCQEDFDNAMRMATRGEESSVLQLPRDDVGEEEE